MVINQLSNNLRQYTTIEFTVSQNGGLPRIKASIYSTDTTFYVLFTYVIDIDYVIRNSDAIIAKKQQK